MYIFICLYIYIFIYLYVYIFIYSCIYRCLMSHTNDDEQNVSTEAYMQYIFMYILDKHIYIFIHLLVSHDHTNTDQ